MSFLNIVFQAKFQNRDQSAILTPDHVRMAVQHDGFREDMESLRVGYGAENYGNIRVMSHDYIYFGYELSGAPNPNYALLKKQKSTAVVKLTEHFYIFDQDDKTLLRTSRDKTTSTGTLFETMLDDHTNDKRIIRTETFRAFIAQRHMMREQSASCLKDLVKHKSYSKALTSDVAEYNDLYDNPRIAIFN